MIMKCEKKWREKELNYLTTQHIFVNMEKKIFFRKNSRMSNFEKGF